MLCTPPAFILSQDQTLECLYLILPKKGQILIRAWLLFTFCLSSISLRIFEFRSRTHTWISPCSMLVLSSCCSIFNDRFSLRSLRRSTIISHRQPLVNPFFEIFSNFFDFFEECPQSLDFIGFLPLFSFRFRAEKADFLKTPNVYRPQVKKRRLTIYRSSAGRVHSRNEIRRLPAPLL